MRSVLIRVQSTGWLCFNLTTAANQVNLLEVVQGTAPYSHVSSCRCWEIQWQMLTTLWTQQEIPWLLGWQPATLESIPLSLLDSSNNFQPRQAPLSRTYSRACMGDPIILEVEVLVAGKIYFCEVENGCKYLMKLVLVTWQKCRGLILIL